MSVAAVSRDHAHVLACVPMRACSLLLIVTLAPAAARAAVDDNAARLVTELVTTALGAEPRFEVLSSVDVRRQLEVEANRQILGCDASSTSCLAEIAGAMGAQLVVSGSLGNLGDVVVLTLNLFDSKEGRAVGRVAVRAKGLAELSERVEGAVQELTGPYVMRLAGGSKTKLLVLGMEPPRGDVVASASVPVSELPSALFWGGVGGLAGGVVMGGTGALFLYLASDVGKQADSLELETRLATALYDRRDTFGGLGFGGLGIGAALIVVGGALVGMASTE